MRLATLFTLVSAAALATTAVGADEPTSVKKVTISLAAEDLIQKLEKHVEAEKKLLQCETTTQAVVAQCEQVQKCFHPSHEAFIKAENTKMEARNQLEAFRQAQWESSNELDHAKQALRDAVTRYGSLLEASARIERLTTNLGTAVTALGIKRSDIESARSRVEEVRRDRDLFQNVKQQTTSQKSDVQRLIDEALKPLQKREEAAQQSFDQATESARAELEKAERLLREALDALRQDLPSSSSPTGRANPDGEEKSPVRRVGFVSTGDGHRRRHGVTPVEPILVAPGPDEAPDEAIMGSHVPSADILPGSFQDGVGEVILGGEFEEERRANPPVGVLDPPVARSPTRPIGPSSREVGRDDPANDWRYEVPHKDRVSLNVGGFNLQLMPSLKQAADIPSAGNRLIVLAAAEGVFQLRIFDDAGRMIVDADLKKQTDQLRRVEHLRRQLEPLWPPHQLTDNEKDLVINAVTRIINPIHPIGEESADGGAMNEGLRNENITSITLLPHPDDPDMLAAEPKRPDPKAEPPAFERRTLVFDAPACFSIVRFKNKYTNYEDEGLRIDEGMTLRVAKDGSYEVEFLAAARAIPVVLRLQLAVRIESRTSTLTLPALVLDPRSRSKSDEFGNMWRVIHRGRSPFLRLAFVHPNSYFSVQRDGMARFGSGVPTQFR